MFAFSRLPFLNYRRGFIFVFLLSILLIGVPIASAQTGTDHPCPPDFPEEAIIQLHLSQEDIVSGKLSFDEIFEAGRLLFVAKFNICDGQGRPASTGSGDKREADEPAFSRLSGPDANACAGCHNIPRAGGAGDIVANVFVAAQMHDPVVTSTDPAFSNFRNTPGMFGAGAIELLAREMTAALLAQRDDAREKARSLGSPITIRLVAKGIPFGILTVYPDGYLDTSDLEGLDPDLIIKPFHQAGRVISLREFSNNAMNHHHGMQSEESYDLNPQRGEDWDEDGVAHELTIGDITAITIWQAGLAIPGRVMPDDDAGRREVQNGEGLFDTIGCTGCHVPKILLDSAIFTEPNPYNLIGNFRNESMSFDFDLTEQGERPLLEKFGSGAIVRAYTDLKRHNLCDDEIDHYCNEQIAQGRFDQDGKPGAHYFLTAKLWDAGTSAPYGHAGDLTTLTQAILAHGGEARDSRDRFVDLSASEQQSVIRFLKSMQVLPEGMDHRVTESELAAAQAGITIVSNPDKYTPSAPQTLTASRTTMLIALLLAALGLGILIGKRSGS